MARSALATTLAATPSARNRGQHLLFTGALMVAHWPVMRSLWIWGGPASGCVHLPTDPDGAHPGSQTGPKSAREGPSIPPLRTSSLLFLGAINAPISRKKAQFKDVINWWVCQLQTGHHLAHEDKIVKLLPLRPKRAVSAWREASGCWSGPQEFACTFGPSSQLFFQTFTHSPPGTSMQCQRRHGKHSCPH